MPTGTEGISFRTCASHRTDYLYSDVVQSGEYECPQDRLTAFASGCLAEVRGDGSTLGVDEGGLVFEQR